MSLSPLGLISPPLGAAIAARGAVSLASKAFSQLLASQESSTPGKPELSSGSSQASILSEIDLETLQDQTELDIQQFEREFKDLLAENGIDFGTGFHLQIGDDGQVKVANSHPQSSDVENLLKAHPDLGNKLRKISAQSGIIQAAARGTQQANESESTTSDDASKIDATKFLKMLDEAQKTQFDLRLTPTSAKISYVAPSAE